MEENIQKKNQNVFFDMKSCILRYGKELNPGEIGCTLSHYKCYREFLQTNDEFVFILEEDISIVKDIAMTFSQILTGLIKSEEPRIDFLSGDYWHWNKKKITRVYSAVGIYAYFII